MGVAGLWDILKPVAKTRSLTELAVTEGFQANPHGLRGYRIGIDASIWFFHAEYGKEGENPVLRTLFFRCATLMKAPFLPLFVFDGPRRPAFKRGKRISKSDNKLIPGMKRIVEAFGFEWRMAPGEAEAELAYLNRTGVIDGILSDDVDNFLFGALTVIRNQSNNLSGNKSNPTLNSEGKDDKNHTRVFRSQDIHDHPDVQLTRGGLILIGLLRGGDYGEGLEGCGVTTAHALARCGFGDTLYEAACTLSPEGLSIFLEDWRQELRQELKTNSRGFLARKSITLSDSIPDTFPKIDILLAYVQPITSESLGRADVNSKIAWSKEPNIAALAGACELFFEWGYREAIIKRFRTVVWPGAVLRILRRAVLNVDGLSSPSILRTPSRVTADKGDGYGTPSKMIAKHFSAIRLESDDESSQTTSDQALRLIVSISRERTHASTDGLLEYRLEVAPGQLVKIAESGLQGLRRPEGPNEWAYEDEGDEEEDERGRRKNGKGKGPVDPQDPLRLWMPGCMVDVVEKKLVKDFKDAQGRKKQKRRVPPQTKSAAPKESSPDPPSRKAKSKAAPPATNVISQPDPSIQTLDDFLPRTPSHPKPHPFSSKIDARGEEESSESEGELPTIPGSKPTCPSPVRKPPNATSNKLSRTSRVAAMFNPPTCFSSSLPSPKTIESNLTLTDSEGELPADIYQTMRPKKTALSTSSKIKGYISLSDSSDDPIKPTSLTSRARKGSRQEVTAQRTLLSHTEQTRREKRIGSKVNGNGTQQISKSPKKSKAHISPRNKDPTKKPPRSTDKSSVISVEDEDEDAGYTGASRPNIVPLQLARARTKGKAAVLPIYPKPAAVEGDIIDLT